MMEQVEPDILYLACTRPAMRLGVPFEAFALNLCGSFLIGIWLGNPFYWAIGVVLHFPMRILASQDHNIFRIGRLWITTKGASLHRQVWGGSSLSPLPSGLPRKPADIAGAL